MNVEDSEQMERGLQDIGLHPSALGDADIVLLNTCSVRKKPEDKAFSMLGRLNELKSARPALVVGVCGCMAQIRADEIRKRAPHVDFVVGTGNISAIPGLISETLQARRFRKRIELPERKGSIVTDVPQRNLRPNGASSPLKAFVPIQYGCDKFCTFCIVPSTRGRERSRPTGDIIDEVRRLVDRGTKEVTLLGQTVNSYGRNLLEGKVPFAQLLWRLADIDGLERIRYTSPYPRDFNNDLIQVHRDCAKVMPHCHLPLQSGDNDVLRAMHRVYTTETFEGIYKRLRTIPNMSVTTDVIVGFPGELDRNFQNTLDIVSRLRFDSAFMFAYSPRPNTPAAALEQVPHEIKKGRLAELISLQNSITCEINSSQVGSVFDVMLEGPSEKNPALSKGLTSHFKTVHVAAQLPVGTITRALMARAHLWGFEARIVA
jgi:tRNA-2-methylthio-N6-dimethylallyladenosine synthase